MFSSANTTEDDLTHLPEVLRLQDVAFEQRGVSTMNRFQSIAASNGMPVSEVATNTGVASTASATPRVASVTVAYNNARVLPRQIEALQGQIRPVDEIVIVDNASTDGTAAMLQSEYPQVAVLRMPENVGYGGAWSAGLTYALEHGHDWVWTFDGDSVPHSHALAALLERTTLAEAGNAQLGMVVALPLHEETGRCYSPQLWNEGFQTPPALLLDQPVWYADLAIASGSMVRREVVENVGLPRADLFLDFTDFEYCLRIRSRGYKIAVVTAAKIAHEIGDAREVRLGGLSHVWNNHAPWREYYITRNLVYAGWWLYPTLKTKFSVVRHLARHAGGVFLFGTHKLDCLKKMAQGFWDGRRAKLGIRFRPA